MAIINCVILRYFCRAFFSLFFLSIIISSSALQPSIWRLSKLLFSLYSFNCKQMCVSVRIHNKNNHKKQQIYINKIGNSSSKQQQQKSAVRNAKCEKKKNANKYKNKTQSPVHRLITN